MNWECSDSSHDISGTSSTVSERPGHSETRHSVSSDDQCIGNARSSGDVSEHSDDVQEDSATVCYQMRSQDSGLATVIEAWDGLPDDVRAAIVAMVKASEGVAL
jgi:hypothetical protein